MSSASEYDLRAQLAEMKAQLAQSKLREKLQESELRAERLENENLQLHATAAAVDKSRSKTYTPNTAPIIEVPDLDEKDLDESFETMMEECLQDEQKRDSLRVSYYQKTSSTEKYYFFLEWASYLRKPEVLEQNTKNSTDVDVNAAGGDDGMRQRNKSNTNSRSPINDDKNYQLPTHTDINGKYRRPEFKPKNELSRVWQIIFYISIVSVLAGTMWLIKTYLQNPSTNQHQYHDEGDGYD